MVMPRLMLDKITERRFVFANKCSSAQTSFYIKKQHSSLSFGYTVMAFFVKINIYFRFLSVNENNNVGI